MLLYQPGSQIKKLSGKRLIRFLLTLPGARGAHCSSSLCVRTHQQKNKKNKKRKERFFPITKVAGTGRKDTKTLFFAPLHASLTVEAAMVLPIFLICMTAALQYCSAMETAVKFGNALAETGKSLASAAYATTCIGEHGEAAELAESVLSIAYAQVEVMKRAGDTQTVKNANLVFSSILDQDQMIDLVLTYQIRSPFGLISLPGRFFLQRASVRAWVGRKTEKAGETEKTEETQVAEATVYVTATGSVYHRDLTCSYLKLSVSSISLDAVGDARNNSGAIYYPCERCGENFGSTVYITKDGNRYHSSVSCSSLKRTVNEKKLSEVGDLRPCSRCG